MPYVHPTPMTSLFTRTFRVLGLCLVVSFSPMLHATSTNAVSTHEASTNGTSKNSTSKKEQRNADALSLMDFLSLADALVFQSMKPRPQDQTALTALWTRLQDRLKEVIRPLESPQNNTLWAAFQKAHALSLQARSLASANALPPATAETDLYTLRHQLLRAVHEPVLPAQPLDFALGAQVYQNHCTSCHGPKGQPTQAPLAAKLAPFDMLAFTDKTFVQQTSVHMVFQKLLTGNRVHSSAMPDFQNILSLHERWCVSVYVLALPYDLSPSPHTEAAFTPWSLEELMYKNAEELAQGMHSKASPLNLGELRRVAPFSPWILRQSTHPIP